MAQWQTDGLGGRLGQPNCRSTAANQSRPASLQPRILSLVAMVAGDDSILLLFDAGDPGGTLGGGGERSWARFVNFYATP